MTVYFFSGKLPNFTIFTLSSRCRSRRRFLFVVCRGWRRACTASWVRRRSRWRRPSEAWKQFQQQFIATTVCEKLDRFTNLKQNFIDLAFSKGRVAKMVVKTGTRWAWRHCRARPSSSWRSPGPASPYPHSGLKRCPFGRWSSWLRSFQPLKDISTALGHTLIWSFHNKLQISKQ